MMINIVGARYTHCPSTLVPGGERRVVIVVQKGSGGVETSPTTINIVWACYMRLTPCKRILASVG